MNALNVETFVVSTVYIEVTGLSQKDIPATSSPVPTTRSLIPGKPLLLKRLLIFGRGGGSLYDFYIAKL